MNILSIGYGRVLEDLVPRQPRFFVPGMPQHAIVRGIDKQDVFFCTDDYRLYLESLGKSAKQYDCAIHAYVLMSNHVHLLITPGTKRALPLFFQAMGRYYVQALNRKIDRVGPLWQGRYRTSLVQDDLYLLTCYRYIELNPVRAGIVNRPGDYEYSSYRSNAIGVVNNLVQPHPLYEALDDDRNQRLAKYRSLFAEDINIDTLEVIRDRVNSCRILGNDRFKEETQVRLGVSVRRQRKRTCRIPR